MDPSISVGSLYYDDGSLRIYLLLEQEGMSPVQVILDPAAAKELMRTMQEVLSESLS